jgi:uracil-DNA glycosylase family 4
MDDRVRQELAAWLKFYRDLGIEDFYRRAPGSASPGSPRAEAQPPAAQAEAAQPPAETIRRVGAPISSGGPPARSLSLFEAPPPPRREHETLEQVLEDLGDCRRCRLAAGRKTIVFGQGNPHAALVFVGEAPGADEDEQGLPFVGRAGQLLNRLIQFIGMKREEVYICNIVKCRPPENRTPAPDEIETCAPFLFRQIEAIQPRLVCCLGAPAMKTLLGIKEGITKVRGQFFDYGNTKALVAYHPAYILRSPREEKILREDFETIRKFLKSPR